MIAYNKQSGTFTLHTKHTTYQLAVHPTGVVQHVYYGPRLRDGCDLTGLLRYADRGFSPNPDEAGTDRTFSLDTTPQEYSTCGVGDFRLPSIEFEMPNGSHTADLRYVRSRIWRGKYTLEGLPAFFGGTEEWETLCVVLRDDAAQVEAELLYGVLEEYDLITRSVLVRNQGKEPVRLCRCASLCLDFQRSDLDMITFDGAHVMERCPSRAPLRPGVQSAGSIRGASSHQHNPFVILCDRDANEDYGLCYGAMLLYSGNFQAEAEAGQFESARLVMGINPYHFTWTLEPGAIFSAPEAAMICSEAGLGEMSRRFHRAIRDHLLRDPLGGQRRPVLVNNWEATYFDFDPEKLLAIAREAAALGVELFVLDDGWFGKRDDDNSGLGDWRVNTDKLPGGLESLAPAINALGLSFGIWVEPEMVSEDSRLYRAHPDWILGRPGQAVGRNQFILDLSREEVQDHLVRVLSEVFEEAEPAYVKWDMNRVMTDTYSAALPPERQGETAHRYILGLYELLERLRQAYPELLVEGCSGGGGRFDLGMLYYTPQIWCSDNTDAIDRLRIQYGTSFCYPVCTMGAHVSAVPNEQNGRITPLETRGITAMSGAFGYELDLSKCTPEEKEGIRRQIETYKKRWKLLHQGDYYRLTDPFRDGPYTAWEQVSPDRREALVSVVAGSTRAAQPFRVLKLKGLDPAARYRVNGGDCWDGGALMHAGYPLPPLTGDYRAVQLYIAAVDE